MKHLVLLALLPLVYDVMGSPPPLRVRDDIIVDAAGRQRIFHGFNAVNKNPPWYFPYMLNETRLDLYKKWGFNAVRLGAMWSGVEPAEGQYNSTYLSVLRAIVDKLAARDMFALLDMHQDVLSSKFGTYDGAPLWLVNSLPSPAHAFPWPFDKTTSWSEGYITLATGKAFQDIYDNANGARDKLRAFWGHVAKTFRGAAGVLGYELINEPWAGDIFGSPELFLPGEAGRRNLMPLYDDIVESISEVDNTTLIFYEPVTWGVLFDSHGIVGSGFDHVPGHLRNRSVLSYHYYCWILPPDSHAAYPLFERAVCDGLLQNAIFAAVKEDLKRVGGSSFLTEFGLCVPDKSHNSTSTLECEAVLNSADYNLQSWTYWDSGFFDDDGHVREDVVRPFARPYARATAGYLLLQKFNVDSGDFMLQYRPDPSISLPTEVFVPVLHFPRGPEVVFITPGATWKFNATSSLVLITVPNSSVPPPSPIIFHMRPKV